MAKSFVDSRVLQGFVASCQSVVFFDVGQVDKVAHNVSGQPIFESARHHLVMSLIALHCLGYESL